MLAAAGIGAILAPPVMGAAAFLIAEFLNITYFDVVKMAVIPALLYYCSIFVMVEADSRRLALRERRRRRLDRFAEVTRDGWHYFASIVAIVVLMARGVTAFRAVFWATVVAVGVELLSDASMRSWPRRLWRPLSRRAAARVVPGRRDDRRRRNHRRHRHADGPGAEGCGADRDAGRRQPPLHGALLGARRVGARSRRARSPPRTSSRR